MGVRGTIQLNTARRDGWLIVRDISQRQVSYMSNFVIEISFVYNIICLNSAKTLHTVTNDYPCQHLNTTVDFYSIA